MKFTIKRLVRKEIETQYGRKWKVSALTEKDEWVSSFANRYTEAWREGMTVDVETVLKGKYINCVWPKEDRPINKPMPNLLIDGRLDEILKLVKDIHNELWERKPKKEMDLPAVDHTTEDVPFDPEERVPEEEF